MLFSAGVALGGVLLAGCGGVATGAESSDAASSTSSATSTATPTATPPPATSDSSSDDPGTLLIETNGDASCEQKQPVLIDLPQTTVTLTGDCGVITVTADFVTLTVDSATSLLLESDASTVTARNLDAVTVSGAQNTVTWTAGAASGTDSGLGNTLTR